MKVGDLVKWQSSFWDDKSYVSPGIIIEKDDSHRQLRYKIMWADGKITEEHAGFLYDCVILL